MGGASWANAAVAARSRDRTARGGCAELAVMIVPVRRRNAVRHVLDEGVQDVQLAIDFDESLFDNGVVVVGLDEGEQLGACKIRQTTATGGNTSRP